MTNVILLLVLLSLCLGLLALGIAVIVRQMPTPQWGR
jgi:hypothetical protein